MKPLDFSEHNDIPRHYARMTRRAWYVVFGAGRLYKDHKTTPVDLAERIHTLYDDIDPGDISGVLENYLTMRNN